MIDLLTKNVRLQGAQDSTGQPCISLTSLELLLTEMQLANAKHAEGKPEYHDALQHVKDKLKTYTWTRP
jgi:hypothetical protein